MEIWTMINARAGRQRARENGERIRRVFALGGARVKTAYTETLEEAESFLEKAAQEKPDLLVCGGGDGTLSQAVNALERKGVRLPLGFIPMGTTNDFASSLGIAKEPARAAEQILKGVPHPLDLGRFQDRAFLYVASFGAFTQASYKADQGMKAAFGHLAYIFESAKELPFVRPCAARIEADGEELEGEYFFGAVSNSISLGGVVKLDPEQVCLDDGQLELTLVRSPKNPLEMGQIFQMISAGKLQGEMVTTRSVSRAVFHCREPFPWSLDGEYAPGEEQVEIAAVPQRIDLVY